MQPDETDIMWERNRGKMPQMKCPNCGKMTTMWIVHELYCEHCEEYIGCND